MATKVHALGGDFCVVWEDDTEEVLRNGEDVKLHYRESRKSRHSANFKPVNKGIENCALMIQVTRGSVCFVEHDDKSKTHPPGVHFVGTEKEDRIPEYGVFVEDQRTPFFGGDIE